jgi:circadian clock protein KaiC
MIENGERLPLTRLATGNAELDRILGGGFPTNSLNVVMGQPGTGKTVFVEQLLFHNANADRPSVFFTTLSEPLGKVVNYLQRFRFYDPEALGSSVLYEDLRSDLVERGPEVVVERATQAIRELGPHIIVIDSFKAIRDLIDSNADMRRLVSDLSGLIAAYDTTAFLVGEYASEDIPGAPEFAVADGILEFSRRGSANRDERFVRVLKLRGSGYQEGAHGFRISGDGLEVFPRLVSPDFPPDYDVEEERIVSGVEGLDRMLSGGLRRGSSTVIVGPAGSGKTTLSMLFASAGVRLGEPALYVNLQENPTQLAQAISSLGLDPSELRENGLRFLYASPVELQIDSLVVQVFGMVQREGIRRVVIDSLNELSLSASDLTRFHDYLYALLQHLASEGVTTALTLEGQPRQHPLQGDLRIFSLVDSIIELGIELDPDPRRFIRVVKARGINHDLAIRDMAIDAGGIRVMDQAAGTR